MTRAGFFLSAVGVKHSCLANKCQRESISLMNNSWREFNEEVNGYHIGRIVMAVTDDKDIKDKQERKQLQIDHASGISEPAKLVKLADKISNLRDIANDPPADWNLQRRRKYFDWAKQVIDQLRGVHPGLESLFDDAYAHRT